MGEIRVSGALWDLPPMQRFLATVGRIAERAPEQSGYETQSDLFRAFEVLADEMAEANRRRPR